MAKFNPCPCCGYLTLDNPAPGTYQICPVCFWEDTNNFFEWVTNNISLYWAQQKFMEIGACQEEWTSYVRR